MKNEIFYNMTDKEKIMLFDLAAQASKENNIDFEKAMGSVIQAFLISKNEVNMAPDREFTTPEPFSMNMAPSQEFASQNPLAMNMAPSQEFANSEPFSMNMAPAQEFANSEPFSMNMAPAQEFANHDSFDFNLDQKKAEDFKSSSDIYGGPAFDPMDTQRTKYDNSITF